MSNNQISRLLQSYLDGLSNRELKAALVAKLQDKPTPTLEEIRRAMAQAAKDCKLEKAEPYKTSTSRPPPLGIHPTPEEKETDKLWLLARYDELCQTPREKLNIGIMGEMRAIHRGLMLRHPEALRNPD